MIDFVIIKEQTVSKFEFYERVICHADDPKKVFTDGRAGVVLGKAKNEQGEWSYAVEIDELNHCYSFDESQLSSTGHFVGGYAYAQKVKDHWREMLHSEHADVREAALDFIGDELPEDAFELILSLIDDPNHEVRETVACNLGMIKNDDRVIPTLVKMASSDEVDSVRNEAMHALMHFSPNYSILNLALQMASGDSVSLQRTGTLILMKYPEPKIIELLEKLIEHEDAYVSLNAKHALSVISQLQAEECTIWPNLEHLD